MSTHLRYIILAAFALSAFGCTNELEGSLTVDGEPFELSSCRSGEIYGFVGVEFVSAADARLRLGMSPTGESIAFYLPAGSQTGDEIGKCGGLTVNQQNSTINDVRNVEGSANLDCSGAGHTVQGTVRFKNCH
ncbi:hypothetical protein [Haliangium sp.]|uniref:hypothetical protein n=1 Tax=Haliangium sp. TaxID=2663208 RepID=UPI003D128614